MKIFVPMSEFFYICDIMNTELPNQSYIVKTVSSLCYRYLSQIYYFC